ncbi:unnamed protein product [Cylicocyclus nassatus]|uniref:Uncharacterized protein n=1 Tax=Cylicocyclus nassatus TaxID=53992 RepID=A0AA36MDT5_CYLNA|nr:unnamed protein product [Cylicocyclus nassatus]
MHETIWERRMKDYKLIYVFDFFAILITLIAYAVVNYISGSSLFTVLPLIPLLSSAAVLPLGVIGLLYQHANLLVIYNTRLSLFVIWCIVWMGVSLIYQGEIVGLIASIIWFIAALLYFWGLYVTSKALTYITTHYRGYDDVDPERVQFIEQMLRDMIDEIKQKEIDIAAGAIPTTEDTAKKDRLSKKAVKKGQRTPRNKAGYDKSKTE